MRFSHRVVWFATGAVLTLAIVATGAVVWNWTRPAIRIMAPQRNDWPRSPAEIKAMFGGHAGFTTITKPERIEAYRIRPVPPTVETSEPTTDYPILAGPVRVAADDASELAVALTFPDSYLWETVKGCMPEYGLCLSFFRGDNRVDVLVCFECNILLVTLNGTVSGGEDFDAIRPLLVRIAKAAFPADSVIQALAYDVPERRER